ncbi:MAG: hypothetical protein IT452_07900 [Planctomycetia bacterium]|nr:hypothetical protein [Planctomycetia bacterium]
MFRHAVLRDAAYQLQLPRDRARAHALAFEAIEELCGGRPGDAPLDSTSHSSFCAHPTDPFAEGLAGHALLGTAARPDLGALEVTYLARAAAVAERSFRQADAARLWLRVAELTGQ